MRTTILTGHAGGIGRAICSEMKRAGDRVVGLDLPGATGGVADELPDRVVDCDLSDMAAIQEALDTLWDEQDVGCLVNCAGLYQKCDFFDLTLEDFERSMAVNVTSPFLLSQQLSKRMSENGGGTIVNIASIAGKIGSPMVPYGTSKAAMIGLTKSLAKVLAPYNVRVNAIAPGVIRTPMAADINPDQMSRQLTNVAMERFGEPHEIASVVRFLCSDGASYMTGSIVDVAGGWMS